MPSNSTRGNYYKKKTKELYESLGYVVQLTEFTSGMFINGHPVFRKVDVFGADMIAMNGKEIIFINSKSTISGRTSTEKSGGRKDFAKYPFPPFVKRHIVMWEPRKKPDIITL